MRATGCGWVGLGALAVALATAGAPVAAGASDTPEALAIGDGAEEAYLGVRLVEETDHPEGGARIVQVVTDSPAHAAGLREGDVVVGFDGAVIRGPLALTRRIQASEPDERVKLGVLRDGRVKTIEVALGRRSPIEIVTPLVWNDDRWQSWQEGLEERMEDLGERLGQGPEAYSLHLAPEGTPVPLVLWGKPKLGVELVETTVELRQHLGGDEEHGVLVSRVLPGTPAERAGMRVGDLILSVADTPVASVDALRDALRERDGSTFSVRVAREGKPTTLQVSLPEPEADRPTGPRAWAAPPLAPPPAFAPGAPACPPADPVAAVAPRPPVPSAAAPPAPLSALAPAPTPPPPTPPPTLAPPALPAVPQAPGAPGSTRLPSAPTDPV